MLVLAGLPVSQGKVTGRVCVVKTLEEATTIQVNITIHVPYVSFNNKMDSELT